MRSMLLVAALAFALPFTIGCNTTTVESDGGDEVEEGDGEPHGEDSGDAWDGTRWVVVGGGHRHHAGCGHHFHHGVWNIHVEGHVHAGKAHHFVRRVVKHHRKKH
ncbi:MAG: hypothetical protein HYY18_14250 [Planctomycetes bacterium]|nr:hypothetical protein [Planctomycetota bacterium]